MAPCARAPTREKTEKPRLRKPAMEKMRRDRINAGIERLRLLLEEDLKPKSKLDKADVLETAVAYLKTCETVTARASPEQCYADGFARCLEETARFLTLQSRVETCKHVVGHVMHPKETRTVSSSAKNLKSPPECTGVVWRPW
ncbi:hairy-related 2 isoform X1 [Silurus asotus]|uniref:Hairy-related 2 isoform X1 n=1 Tax=Silurus asotus TaxID=30991 RepID=A0AAD5AWP1_SILAS|nr:hairy-related 2 isoform X1 [Silurus asotus]